ncbi:MAG TPA: glycogen debranching N-terminal domain-containing protein [Methylomirabilota bacterium]|nr:glycogen debranching N-terminal domain-containing protein [Methylomirabilota bacterium]
MSGPVPHGDATSSSDRYYILAASETADRPKLVLKHQESFFVADQRGDFPDVADSEFGLYVRGTRFLRRLELRLDGQLPFFLGAGVSSDNVELWTDVANPDIPLEHGETRKGRTLRVRRRIALDGDEMYQHLTVESFDREERELDVAWWFAADFADVFEVRGLARARRGAMLPTVHEKAVASLGYRGLDEITRVTQLDFFPAPHRLEGGLARYRLVLPAGARTELGLVVSGLQSVERAPTARSFPDVIAVRHEEKSTLARQAAEVRTDNALVNRWIERSASDLRMLSTETPQGRIAYAGIPWYVAPFGRDSLITALQVLPFDPDLARGTLRFLAHHQGRRDDAFTDQESGKILHEYRQGEMANCREIAFIPYYGSVDATPLFCILLAECWRWTGDLALMQELWPALESALSWMSRVRASGHPYLTYSCRSERGLVHQGWKDSHDAIMHASGEPAAAPIALVEAQGYLYAALQAAATLADAMGRAEESGRRRDEAWHLRERFERDFWMEEEGFYALALDGFDAPCRVVSSNPGHCLWSGIVATDRAPAVARRLTAGDLFSGWGVRTLAAGQPCYNPMSYHNGTVWPHDTAIAATGLQRYGLRDPFVSLASGLFDAVTSCDGFRMPELFCGFGRQPDSWPTRYPVACAPQAWAAGTVFQLLAAMLGLTPDAPARRLTLNRPILPPWLDWIAVRALRLGDDRVDLLVSRGDEGARLEHFECEGDVEVELIS